MHGSHTCVQTVSAFLAANSRGPGVICNAPTSTPPCRSSKLREYGLQAVEAGPHSRSAEQGRTAPVMRLG